MAKTGKTQTFSREYNIELVLNLLRKRPYSLTEIASELSLSSATVSSIIKELEEADAIRVNEVTSVNGLGRKRVNYEINPNYGLILGVNISNLHASISLIDMQQKVLESSDVQVDKYNTNALYKLVLEATSLLMHHSSDNTKLRCIVITLPGRVNSVTGELVLSKQFDKELFSEKHFIQNLFNKQFPGVPILLANDNNVMAIGELNNGNLKDTKNGIYFNIDFGIGGGIIIDHKLYEGDLGYAGEFGLIKYYDGKSFNMIDEFVSIRALLIEASKIVGRELSRDELFEEYKNNPKVKEYVLSTASIVGNSIVQLCDILDISKIIISGRVTMFGEEYLKAVKKASSSSANNVDISYSSLRREAEIYGTSALGMEYIFSQIRLKK